MTQMFDGTFDTTLVGRLRARAGLHPDREALVFLADGETVAERCSYQNLDARARAVAAHLQTRTQPADRALLLCPGDLNYVSAFLGCLYAGVIAVPAYPPESLQPQHLLRLLAIARDADPRIVLTTSALLEPMRMAASALPQLAGMTIVAVDEIEHAAAAAAWRPFEPGASDIAFLQYTSGSTATPRGVMVGHDNLMANEEVIRRGFGLTEDDTIVSWLPLYHDMGLIGGLLQPLYSGARVVMMPPQRFLERPARWLQAISRHGGTVSGGPDFAFRLCTDRIGDAACADLDLRSWKVAFSGAEPVRAQTLRGFADRFAAVGFDAQALYPCYGLAEATLFVTGGARGEGAATARFDQPTLDANRAERDEAGTALVGCGRPCEEHAVQIVDVATKTSAAPGAVGEIWVSGPSVARGYWRQPEATAERFVEAEGVRYLRTGDLGFSSGDQLFVTGRLKDLIIVRGRNLYPQDVEQTVTDAVAAVRPGRAVAFAWPCEGEETIGVAAEISPNRRKQTSDEEILREIRSAVAEAHQAAPTLVLLLAPGALPRTSSGKLQRGLCRRRWQDGKLPAFAVYQAGVAVTEPGRPNVTPPQTPTEQSLATIWREVLGAVDPGREAGFFALGGDSLASVGLLARIERQFGVALELRTLFEAPTLQALAAAIERRQAALATVAVHGLEPITAVARTGVLPLSHAQERLWFLAALDPESTAYNIVASAQLVGTLDLDVLDRALTALVVRHESLRTTFAMDDGRPVQRIAAPGPAQVMRVAAVNGQAIAQQEASRPFDLARGPLLRVTAVTSAPGEHLLLVAMHHIVSDGWSMNLLVAELTALYAAELAGGAPALPALAVQPVDHASWQRRWLQAGAADAQLAYWKAQLGGDTVVLELPADRPAPAARSHLGARLTFAIDPMVAARCKALAAQEGATLFMVLLAAWKTLLYRTTGQTDLRVGVPVANRTRIETEGLIGLFVNTQVLRTQVDGRLEFRALLAQVKDAALGAQAHQDLPFEQLVDALHPRRSLGHNPLYQVMYDHQRRRNAPLRDLPGLRLGAVERQVRATDFDLTLETEEVDDDGGGALTAALTYATDRFEAATVARIRDHFQALLAAAVTAPGRALADLPLLSGTERAQLMAWSSPPRPLAVADGVPAWIDRQIAARPDAVAVVCQSQRLTFAQLDQGADRLAARLRARGVGPEILVGICLERSVDLVVAMLAVWRAGGAYVPLDPGYPAERVAYMAADAQLAVLITQSSLGASLPELPGVARLVIDDPGEASGASQAPFVAGPGPASRLAYVIYTSGSTGRPKGVAVAHDSLTMHCQAAGAIYGMGPGDCALHFASVSFDGAVEQWAVPLMHGARLVLSDPDLWSGQQTAQVIAAEGVTVVYPPTAHLQELVAWARAGGHQVPGLRVCTVGGEAVPRETVQGIREILRPAKIINGYGPTETVITPLLWQSPADTGCTTAYAPIGRPVGARTVHVLDRDLNPVPVGVVGEIYLGGTGMARGYHRRAGLTAERFVPDPFSVAPGARLYRSGDLGRWLADGTVEFVGRIDHQVKIRGFRIELGEIEARLREHPAVRDAVVVARETPAGRKLVGYVGVEAAVREGGQLKAYLAAGLPEHMVPAQIVVLTALPRTPAGKIDRAALPEPGWQAATEYQAPRTAAEVTLAEIWQTLLGRAPIGIRDNFFEIGGDSILSIQVVSRARTAGLAVTAKDLFAHQTIEELAQVARAIVADATPARGPAAGQAPLTPIQADFFARDIPRPEHFNQAVLLTCAQRLDEAALAVVLRQLVEHHDGLRLRFVRDEGGWVQRYASVQEDEAATGAERLWARRVGSAAEVESVAAQAQTSLNLAAGPLLRAVSMTLPDGSGRLLLVVHHLVVDGVSWRVLLEDLAALYQGVTHGQPVTLPARTSSFKEWAEHLRTRATDAALLAEIDHWHRATGGAADLIADDPTGSARERDVDVIEQRLEPRLTRRLVEETSAAYRTGIDDLLLTALARALRRWTGAPATLVEIEGHGREATSADLDLGRTVGWFTAAYPVRLEATDDLGASIKAIKEQRRQVPGRGLGFGLLRHLAGPEAQARMRALPEARITFNYLGQGDTALPAAGPFDWAREPSGNPRDPAAPLRSWIAVDALVLGGALVLRWSHSRCVFRAETIAQLVALFDQELQAVIEHCAPAAGQPLAMGGLTVSDFPAAGLSQVDLDRLPIPARDVEDVYRLTPMQQGILSHALESGADDPYAFQRAFVLRGNVVPALLEAAFGAAVARHPGLRAVYLWEALETPVQVVLGRGGAVVRVEDWRGTDPSAQRARLERELAAELGAGFDFAAAAVTRLRLLQVEDATWWLIWSHHHIALDGWSTGLVLRDVLAAQRALALDPTWRPARAPSFGAYVRWREAQDQGSARAYWQRTLQGFEAATPLPGGLTPAEGSPRGDSADRTFVLSSDETHTLRTAGAQRGITLSTLVQAAWALLLGRHGDCDDVVFGATVSGRSAAPAGADETVGLFINTQPVRVRLAPALRVADWLAQLQADSVEARSHEQFALAEIQRAHPMPDGQPLFRSVVVFENYPLDPNLRRPEAGLQIDLLDRGAAGARRGRNNFPLSLVVGSDETLTLTLAYRTAWFDSATIEALGQQIIHLLGALARGNETCVGDLALAPAGKSCALLGEPLPSAPDLLTTWAASVAADPHALAVADGDWQVSRAELDAAANQLARTLRGIGVGAEVRVAICAPRSVALVVGLLGTLKAHGVYLPLDPTAPIERLRSLIADSGAALVLTCAETQALCADLDCPTLALESDVPAGDATAVDLPVVAPPAAQAAYVIYTSGSTGAPKGVVVSHGALAAYLTGVLERLRPAPGSSMAMVSTVAADLGHTVLFGALYSGRPLHLVPAACGFDPDLFAAFMAQRQVGVLKIVPSHLRGLLHAARGQDVLPLHTLILGGEASTWDLIETVRALRPECRVLNHYGPTETTVGVLTHEVDARDPGASAVPIGRPLPGGRAWVLDRDLNPVPAGVVGELYVGGPGVARGYLGRAGLTADRFVPDPAGTGARLYRTGDRVRLRAGQIEFLGRGDDQVKIRGYRVELGEVTAALRGLAAVRDAVVVLHVDPTAGDEGAGLQLQLVGYYVPREGSTVAPAEIAAALAAQLPGYMVPTLVALDALPLTPNGKLDRRALPGPQAPMRGIVAPSTDTERTLAEIWQAVLKTEQVGVTDNFFALGGDSIRGLQVVARARRRGLALEPGELFERPTIAALAARLAAPVASGPGPAVFPAAPLVAVAREGRLPLSHAQERLWFLAQLEPDSAAYHIVGGLRIGGALNVLALEQAVAALVARHEALRTTFPQEAGQAWQQIHAHLPIGITQLDLRGRGGDEAERLAAARTLAAEEARRPFDLAAGPLLRLALLEIGRDDRVLLLTMHHIVSDGWSMNVVMAELAQLYGGFCTGRPVDLKPLPIQFVDHAVWQRAQLAAGQGERQLAYWRARLGTDHPALELPLDRPRPAVQSHRGAILPFVLPADLGRAVVAFAQSQDATPFMVLLAAWKTLLYRHTGATALRVGVPLAGRGRPETEGVVGFFVNTQVMATQVDGQLGFAALLARVKEASLGAQAHQDLPFEQLVGALAPERSLAHNPLFQVMFDHQRRALNGLGQLPGLAVQVFEMERDATQFDLALHTEEDEAGRITGTFAYATDLFDRSTIAHLSQHLLQVLTAAVATPDRPIGGLALLTAAETATLTALSACPVPYDTATLVPQWLTRQAALRPDAPALAFSGEALSYRAFEQRANQLAWRLQRLGVGPEVRVAVALQRSLDLLISVWAILKAGGAYVPLDPEYPIERLRYMLADAAPAVLLTSRRLRGELPVPEGLACVCLDDEILDDLPVTPPPVDLHPENLAYVIYTSGSTGQPKGAGNTHAGMLNRLLWMQQAYGLSPADTVLQKTPFSFDVSVWELFWPMMVGAQLVIAQPGDHRDPARLVDLIQTHDVTTLHFVPSMLQAFLAHDEVGGCKSLARVVCSGEALPAALEARVFDLLPGAQLFNLYGPTEAAVDVTHWTCVRDDDPCVPIGRPIANLVIHILDADLGRTPVGVAGELYIGGVGLARGYHDRPGLTAARFVPDPFASAGAGGRLYRTGDRARWRRDGTLEYLGRLDDQVKIRGFRIELGEIEALLRAQDGVTGAVVVAHDDRGERRLVAYVEGPAGQDAAVSATLRARLSAALPDYMVPGAIVPLDHLPLGPSGKVNRAALPAPTWKASGPHVPPGTATEVALARIWAEVLRVETIGRDDGFFALGGHSLLATQVIARIRGELGVALPLRRMFEAATLGHLAALVDHAQAGAGKSQDDLGRIESLLAELGG